MTHALDVITFGEAMMLLVADRPGPLEQAEAFYKRTAGAETNVAIGLARLGLKVGWASRLGTDSHGPLPAGRDAARGHRLLARGVRRRRKTPASSSRASVTDGSDPPVEYHRQGSAASHMCAGTTSTRPGCCGAATCTPPACFPALSASTPGRRTHAPWT